MKRRTTKMIRKIIRRIRLLELKNKKLSYDNFLRELELEAVQKDINKVIIKYDKLVYYQNDIDLYKSKLFDFLKKNRKSSSEDSIFELEKEGWAQLINKFNAADLKKQMNLLIEKDKSFYNNAMSTIETIGKNQPITDKEQKEIYKIRNKLDHLIPEEETEYSKLSNKYRKNQHHYNLKYKYNFAYVLSLQNDIVSITHYQGNVIRYELSKIALNDLAFLNEIGYSIFDDSSFYYQDPLSPIEKSKYKLYELTLSLNVYLNGEIKNWIKLFLFSFLTDRLILFNSSMEIKFFNKKKTVNLININQFIKLSQLEKQKYLNEIDKVIGFKIQQKSSNINLTVCSNEEEQSLQFNLNLKNSTARGFFNTLFESNFNKLTCLNFMFGQINCLFTISKQKIDKENSRYFFFQNEHVTAEWYLQFWSKMKQYLQKENTQF